ncbi:MAG: TIGR04255 family protein [Candidatus Eremiobacteraeota bacterium]|nr:TIGR04255 family protein [Candidatus Eremiobacteraeota bacterium]
MESTEIQRSLDPLVLDKSPLVYFLAQVRFSPILAMADHVSTIQEHVRKLGYPLYAEIEAHNVIFAPPAPPKIENNSLWTFFAADRQTGIVLANNYVAYQAVRYTTYEETLPKIIEVLQAVHGVAGISLFERVGLRYVDVVTPNWDAGEKFATYLDLAVIGISGPKIGAKTLHHSTIYFGQTELGTIVIRFTTNDAPNILPPDVAVASLELPKVSVPDGQRIGTLDFDHYLECKEPFSIARSQSLLADLHDAIARAFNECATDKARELWGKK